MSTKHPYPPGHDFSMREKFQRISAARSEPLNYFLRGLEFDGISYMSFPVVGGNYFVTEPDLVRDVLVKRAKLFQRHERYTEPLKRVVGNGILSTDGKGWLQQRRLIQPAFHRKRIASYADMMTNATLEMMAQWQTDETRDINADMMGMTLMIVARTLFGAETGNSVETVAHAVDAGLRALHQQTSSPVPLPAWVPTPNNQRMKAAVRTLDDILLPIIQARRSADEDTGDLLSMLLQAVDEEDGSGMSDQQLRDELMTMFLAGHETTSNAMTWAWVLLSQHPDSLHKLHHEIDTVLAGRAPTLADLGQMPYGEKVIKETMRLYPPAWMIIRTPIEDMTLGGYQMDKGSGVFISPYVMHRNPKFFPEPERFDPERFSAENEAALPRNAYMPFGDGPHICIGNTFAMMEARLILATVAQQFTLDLLPNQDLQAEAVVTLRPKNAIQMHVRRR